MFSSFPSVLSRDQAASFFREPVKSVSLIEGVVLRCQCSKSCAKLDDKHKFTASAGKALQCAPFVSLLFSVYSPSNVQFSPSP
jgi:hypothetical protein